MSYINLLPTDSNRRAHYLSQHIPPRYMEDFSLLGFTVSTFTQATALLRSAGYHIIEQHGGARITINSADELIEIKTLFAEHGITSTYGDLADTLYQA